MASVGFSDQWMIIDMKQLKMIQLLHGAAAAPPAAIQLLNVV